MATKRRLILEAIGARLAEISQANGYETDAGARIYIGEAPDLGEDDPDAALAILPGDEEPRWQGENVSVIWPITIAAIAKATIDGSYLVVEAVIGDIKRAIEQPDRRLHVNGIPLLNHYLERGAVRGLEREPEHQSVGATITYDARFTEGWGTP